MPSLIRFLVVAAVLGAISYGALYVLANQYEPKQVEVSKPLADVRIKKP